MPLETATYINDLVTSNPAASDGLNQADDHMRLIKAVLKNTFPGPAGAYQTSGGGVILRADGAANGPAVQFASEPTLGFYRSGAGQISVAGGLLVGQVPIGGLMDFAGTAAPTGYLACDGQALSRTTYSALFTAIGTTWGAGDGSTTFNIPNLGARFRRHRDNLTLAGAVGNTQGPANLTHTHSVSGTTGTENAAHSHAFSGTTGGTSTGGAFSAVMPNGRLFGNFQSFTSGTAIAGIQLNNGTDSSIVSNGNMDHTHSFSGTTGTENIAHAHTFSATTAASGDANESRPYSATVLTCIRVI